MNFRMKVHLAENQPPIIELEGEVSVYTAPQLKQQMLNHHGQGIKHSVVDLTNVDYLDSTALGVLIGGLKQARDKDGNLVLVCPSPKIRRVFMVTGLDKIFDIFDTVDDALESLAETATTA